MTSSPFDGSLSVLVAIRGVLEPFKRLDMGTKTDCVRSCPVGAFTGLFGASAWLLMAF